MTQVLMFAAWIAFGVWMFRCLGLPAKQCLQCVIGRYIGLIVVLIAITLIPN